MAANHLFDTVKEHLTSMRHRYAAVDPSGRKLLEVKSRFQREAPSTLCFNKH
ncbi:uncharacterized protein THITE_2116526 [Thermothielavioides terrestris NRRL 8126]|jgi:hypothetical protein|uniref:Uncharacterized protein n=2 Tax=Thermothielavioides terrestris TaxID=2587410 RepID=G2R6F9_THETT|nr:uncharacterized protein THITE_2116526 [Thermothielavioides terrestris NRRL 8126]AEO67644.1 hypothetical protein THITE_2116526 [Thermothielavioides terrestris NRRL 8126]